MGYTEQRHFPQSTLSLVQLVPNLSSQTISMHHFHHGKCPHMSNWRSNHHLAWGLWSHSQLPQTGAHAMMSPLSHSYKRSVDILSTYSATTDDCAWLDIASASRLWRFERALLTWQYWTPMPHQKRFRWQLTNIGMRDKRGTSMRIGMRCGTGLISTSWCIAQEGLGHAHLTFFRSLWPYWLRNNVVYCRVIELLQYHLSVALL